MSINNVRIVRVYKSLDQMEPTESVFLNYFLDFLESQMVGYLKIEFKILKMIRLIHCQLFMRLIRPKCQ